MAESNIYVRVQSRSCQKILNIIQSPEYREMEMGPTYRIGFMDGYLRGIESFIEILEEENISLCITKPE